MATEKTREQLREEAIASLAASRAEIGGEMQRLRSELSPKAVMHRVVDHHKGAVVGTAGVVGLASLFLIIRRIRRGPAVGKTPSRHIAGNPVEPKVGSQVLRVLVGSLLPVLLKSSVIDPLTESLTRPKPDP